MTALDEILSRLDGVRQRGSRWSSRCPAHADSNPSLQITAGDKGVLLHCWSGCGLPAICESLGLQQKDLFFDAPISRGQRLTPKPPCSDRRAVAFQFELAALDLRMRADRIIEAGKNLDVANLSDDELDQALGHVTQAHADSEQAKLFEDVADTVREREISERNNRERQTMQ